MERFHRIVTRYGTHEVEYFIDKFREYYGQHLQDPSPARRSHDACLVALKRLPVT